MLRDLIKNQFANYTMNGALFVAGLMPDKVLEDGAVEWEGYGDRFVKRPGHPMDFGPVEKAAAQTAAEDTVKGLARYKSYLNANALTSAVAPALTAVNIGYGFHTGGIGGAINAAVWESAVASATYRFGYGSLGTSGPSTAGFMPRLRDVGKKIPGTEIVSGGGGTFGAGWRGIGAGIGASVGQQILGWPGAYIGAYIGAAPIRSLYKGLGLLRSHPIVSAAVVAGIGTYYAGKAAGYTAMMALREGRKHRLVQKQINTAGNMAAFMTRNAFTMRSRAILSIQKSHLNARAALGNEASILHMPGRSYGSRYR